MSHVESVTVGSGPTYTSNPLDSATNVAEGFLYFTGGSSDAVTTPDNAALDITDAVSLRFIGKPIAGWDSNAAAAAVLIGKENTGQRSYVLRRVSGAKTLGFVYTTDGSTTVIRTSTAVVPAAATGVRADFDGDVAGANTVTFYYTTDDVDEVNDVTAWTQLGDVVNNAGTVALHSGTAVLSIGVTANSGAMGEAYLIRAAQVRNGSDAVVANPIFGGAVGAFQARPAAATDSAGRLWSIGGNTWEWRAPLA